MNNNIIIILFFISICLILFFYNYFINLLNNSLKLKLTKSYCTIIFPIFVFLIYKKLIDKKFLYIILINAIFIGIINASLQFYNINNYKFLFFYIIHFFIIYYFNNTNFLKLIHESNLNLKMSILMIFYIKYLTPFWDYYISRNICASLIFINYLIFEILYFIDNKKIN